jgi:molybdate transport repressor ModE-like protein
MAPRALDAAALRLVRAVQTTGSVTAAAQHLGLTQPAASQQLRAVERLIGTPVVVRSGRGVRLTEAGQVLARSAVQVQAALDATLEEVAAVASLRVRLAAFPSAAATLLPRALAALRAAHPGIATTFVEAEPPEALSLLDAGRCEIALTFRDPDVEPDREGPRRAAVPLLRDEVHLVLPRGERVVGDPVDLAVLADRPWIAGCEQCRAQLVRSCTRAGFDPGIDFATDDYVTVLGLVRAGLGVATLPGLALAAVPHEGVDVHRPAQRTFRLVEAVHASGMDRVPAVAAALHVLRETATAAHTGP